MADTKTGAFDMLSVVGTAPVVAAKPPVAVKSPVTAKSPVVAKLSIAAMSVREACKWRDAQNVASYGYASVLHRYGRRAAVGEDPACIVLHSLYVSLAHAESGVTPGSRGNPVRDGIDRAFSAAVESDTLDDFIHAACSERPTWWYYRWCERRFVIGSWRTATTPEMALEIKTRYYGDAGQQCRFCGWRTDRHSKGCCVKA